MRLLDTGCPGVLWLASGLGCPPYRLVYVVNQFRWESCLSSSTWHKENEHVGKHQNQNILFQCILVHFETWSSDSAYNSLVSIYTQEHTPNSKYQHCGFFFRKYLLNIDMMFRCVLFYNIVLSVKFVDRLWFKKWKRQFIKFMLYMPLSLTFKSVYGTLFD